MTSYRRRLLVYWEAWKKNLHVEHSGVSQFRVLTITECAERVENTLSTVDEITAGKDSVFFLFGRRPQITQTRLLEVPWMMIGRAVCNAIGSNAITKIGG